MVSVSMAVESVARSFLTSSIEVYSSEDEDSSSMVSSGCFSFSEPILVVYKEESRSTL